MDTRNEPPIDNLQDTENAEMSLRDHLLAAHAASQQASQSPPNHQPHCPSSDQEHPSSTHSTPPINHGPTSPPPRQHQPGPVQLDGASQPPPPSHASQSYPPFHQPAMYPALDPQITTHYGYQAGLSPGGAPGQGPPYSSAQQQAAIAAISPEPEVGSPEGGGGKKQRELSNSKRAAQNRAAQRAFRQRKESYIKKLETDVRNASALPALQENLQRVQQENFHMRDYIMVLQSRLLEAIGSFPPPPSMLELRDPRSGEPIQTHPPPQRDDGPAQGGPPPLPQPAPTASMALAMQPQQDEHVYPGLGAEAKVGEDAHAYPSYEVSRIDRPERPPPPLEGGEHAVR